MTIASVRVTRLLCPFLSIAFSAAELAFAQELTPPPSQARRTIAAERLAPGESITLDGSLDEAVWQRADVARDFVQIDPDNGEPATEQTEFRIAFDSNTLYLAVICHDSEAGVRLTRYQKRRDEFLQQDDKVQWTIDTFLDGRTGYFFETNPSGAMADALMGTNGQNRQWDGIWNERVQRNSAGWSFEVEIPFRTLNFNPNSDTWGINVSRTLSRKNENSIWMGWARNQGVSRMTNAGRLTGLSGVTQGHGLDVKPYVLGTAQDARVRNEAITATGQAGVDLFYNPTPALRTNLTINTDFAQTEVDQRQVNLTRFSLLYPEKRDFFLDGATFFDFASPGAGAGGNNSQNNSNLGSDLIVNPFFSRRIGLTDAGNEQKILYGTKATGQLGGEDIGILHVRTGSEDDLVGENFTVARLKHRLLRQSYVGAAYTRRDPDAIGADTRQTLGLDFRLATSTFRGRQNLSLSGWYVNATQRALSETQAYGATLAYPNDRWNANFDVRTVERDFNPAVGFVTRNAYRRYLPFVNFGPRPRNYRTIRQYNFSVTADIQTTLDNQKVARNFTLKMFEAEMAANDRIAVLLMPRSERLDSPFNINMAPGRRVTLPRGAEYDFLRYQVNWRTSNRRVVAFDGRYEAGDFYSGKRNEFVSNVTFRISPGLFVYTAAELNSITLPAARFNTRLYRVVPELQFTPFLTWVNNVQYDTVSGVAGWQSRFRWIVRPGNDIYIVYTHNWLDDPLLAQFATQDRRLSTKAVYTYRF
jgi:uncharacterized protein DUF5916/cellulose/xylan binding protein with CBM9 domain